MIMINAMADIDCSIPLRREDRANYEQRT